MIQTIIEALYGLKRNEQVIQLCLKVHWTEVIKKSQPDEVVMQLHTIYNVN